MSSRDPALGMPDDVREDFAKAPRAMREAYLEWWPERPNRAAAHRDTWWAFAAGWECRNEIVNVARHKRVSRGTSGKMVSLA